ncbi:hypothetical protein F4818DRAFT_407622 [Hypoxylon cercidicola]|nr:hypothetical protein F4818DRAFT_407622 [Hypoxylon cercidicola]
MCKATHDGHYPYRHSVACALHRSEVPGPLLVTRSPNSHSAKGKSVVGLKNTVPRHHYASFHGHHHIVEHLTSEVSDEIHEHYTTPLENSIEERITPASSPRPATKLGVQHHEHVKPPTPVQRLERLERANSLRGSQRIVPPSHSKHDSARLPPSVNQWEEQTSCTEPPQRIWSAKPIESSSAAYKGGESGNGSHAKQSHRREFDHNQPEHIPLGDQRYQDNHTIDNVVNRHKTPKGQPNPHITKGIVDDIVQSRSPIPRGYVLSPPPWLKTPSKEAGDARSRLRHVNAKYPRDPSSFRAAEKINKSLRSLTRRSIREPIEKLDMSSHDFLRISAPSPTTAWHVTQHQRPEFWMGDSSEHIHSRASYEVSPNPIKASSVSPRGNSPAGNQQPSSRYRHSPTHLRGEDIRYSHNAFLSSSSAPLAALHSHQSIEQPSHAYKPTQGQYQNETDHPEANSSDYQIGTHNIRGHEQSPSSIVSCFSRSPVQPRHIVHDVSQATSESRTLALEAESKEHFHEASEYEIYRPSPIAPPNHDCGWKNRYLALTAEIRLLKAELSTRASLRGTDIDYTGQERERTAAEDDDLGIQSVTIILRLRGRDDLIINTDLMRD